MFCPKCGEKNIEGAKFCKKCGANLEKIVGGSAKSEKKVVVQNNKSVNTNSENVVGDIFKHMIVSFIKPFKSFKKLEKQLSTTKYSLIYSGIVCGIVWILSIISTIFSAAKTTNPGWFSTFTTWSFKMNYVKIIFVNLFVYTAIIAAIAGVYCLGSLIAKKTISYMKMLSITCTAIMPYVISTVFLAPLFGLIHSNIEVFFAIIGLVYSILIFFGLIKEEINFKDKEKSLLFHFATAGVLALIFYYTFIYFGQMNVRTLF